MKVRIASYAIIATLLLAPAIHARIAPSSPQHPTDYGTGGNFQVQRIQIDQIVNQTFANFPVQRNPDNKWYTFLYVPQNAGNIPIHIFLHGHEGEDPKYYDNIVRTVSSRGILGIYAQHPPFFRTDRIADFIQQNYPELASESSIIQTNAIRYKMVWEAIQQIHRWFRQSKRLLTAKPPMTFHG